MNKKIVVPLLATVILASVHLAGAQQSGKLPRIGLLFTGESSPPSPNVEAFRQGLRDLGYVEGKNIVLEYRYAEGKIERLPHLAEELVRLPVDVIVTALSPAIHAAKRATDTIPIVFAVSGNPMATGYVASLARPGGNVTGLSVMDYELSGKRLELLTEALRKASRVAVLWNPGNGAMVLKMKEVRSAAQALRVEIKSLEVRDPQDFDRALAALPREHPDALLTLADPLTLFHRDRIIEMAAKSRVPAMYEGREFVEAGGLMSYGPSIEANYRRAATYVDKISQRRQAGGITSGAANEIRAGNQSENSEADRPDDSPVCAVPGGQGDQVNRESSEVRGEQGSESKTEYPIRI